jgi:hypothetical protein
MECKHRWVEVDWGKKSRNEGSYMFHCIRCYQCRIAQLITKEKAPTL